MPWHTSGSAFCNDTDSIQVVIKNQVGQRSWHIIMVCDMFQFVHLYAKNYECNGQNLLIRMVRYSLDGTSFSAVWE